MATGCFKLPLWAHISFAALGVVAGFLGGVVFVAKFANLHAGKLFLEFAWSTH